MSAKDHIIAVMRKARKPLALHEIQSRIISRYGALYETTAISARLRDEVKKVLSRSGQTIIGRRREGGQKWEYWIVAL